MPKQNTKLRKPKKAPITMTWEKVLELGLALKVKYEEASSLTLTTNASPSSYGLLADMINEAAGSDDLIRDTWLREFFWDYYNRYEEFRNNNDYESLNNSEPIKRYEVLLDACAKFICGKTYKEYTLKQTEKALWGTYHVYWAGTISNLPKPRFYSVMKLEIGHQAKLVIADEEEYYKGPLAFKKKDNVYIELVNTNNTEKVIFLLNVGESTRDELTIVPGVFLAGDTSNTYPCSGPVLLVEETAFPLSPEFLDYFAEFYANNSLIKSWSISRIREEMLRFPHKKIKEAFEDSNKAKERKIELYFGQKFYIYYYENKRIGQTSIPGIGRAVLAIGPSKDNVYLYGGNAQSFTSYEGKFDLVASDMLVFSFRTKHTKEKDLSIKVKVGPERVYPYAVGTYSNVGSRDAPIAGTVVLEHMMSSEQLLADDPVSINAGAIPDFIKAYLSTKEKNYIATPSKGLFTAEAFWEFLYTQEEKKKLEQNQIKKPVTVFMASPIGSNIEDYKELRPEILKIKKALKSQFDIEAYYTGEDLDPGTDFISDYLSSEIDFQKLNNANLFLLFYPRKEVSGALVEIGWALGQQKHCFIFFKDKKDLPLVVRELNIPTVRYYEYSNPQELPQLVERVIKKIV